MSLQIARNPLPVMFAASRFDVLGLVLDEVRAGGEVVAEGFQRRRHVQRATRRR
jgi:hypothetical protein